MSNQISYLVNDRERFSTPEAAIEFAFRSVCLDRATKLAAKSSLLVEDSLTLTYGFTTVEIKPVKVDAYVEQQLEAIAPADEFGYKLVLSSAKGKTNHLNITPEQFAKIKQLLVYSGEAKC